MSVPVANAMALPIFPVCDGAFAEISKSILHAEGEISSEMKLISNILCFRFPDEGFKKGSRMHAAHVPYCNFSMHTHPLIAYCSALCNLGHPSGDDMRAWFEEAHGNNGWPSIHLCFAIEGTYYVRVRILDKEFVSVTKKLAQLVFVDWAMLHNVRSTKYTSSEDQVKSQPKVWTDNTNKTTWGHVLQYDEKTNEMPTLTQSEKEKLKPILNRTIFEVHFVPNVITFKGRHYLGEMLDKENTHGFGIGLPPVAKDPFYKIYLLESVKATCAKQQSCEGNSECATYITNIIPSASVYPMFIDNCERRRHEQEAYSRIFDLVIAHHSTYGTELTFNKAYDRIGGEKWLFHSDMLYIDTKDGKVGVIKSGTKANRVKAELLQLIKKVIMQGVQELQTNSYGMSADDVSLMRKYYLNKDFTVNELPWHASFIDSKGRMVSKPTGLRGLNRPEGVKYGKILSAEAAKQCTWNGNHIDRQCDFECNHRRLYFSLDGVMHKNAFGEKGVDHAALSDLIAHEVAHVDDVLWNRNNHDDVFRKRHEALKNVIQM